MSKNIWKYILYLKNDRELSFLCQNFAIQIPGFRKKVPENMNRMLVSLILQPKNFKRLSIDKNVSNKDYYQIEEILSAPDSESLQGLVEKEYSPSQVLETLLINKKYKEAEILYNFLINRYDEIELNKLESDNKKETNEKNKKILKTKGEDDKNYHKITKQLQDKIKNLKNELENTHAQNNTLKQKLVSDRKENNLQIQKLKIENKKLQKSIDLIKNDYSSLKELLLESQSREESLLNKIKDLEITKFENAKKTDPNIKKGIDIKNEFNITIVGKPSNSLIDLCEINFTVLDRIEITDFDLSSQDEVWILTYQVDKKIKQELLESGFGKPIRLIKTFTELKQAIQRRMNVNGQQPVGS